jgi:hypothetical protein
MGALISCSACSKSSPKVLTPQQCRIGLVQSPGHRHQIPGDALVSVARHLDHRSIGRRPRSLSSVEGPSARSQMSRSGGLKVRKQCLRVVGWLQFIITATERQLTGNVLQHRCVSRNQPVLSRHRFSADYPPIAEERRANLLPAIPHRRCLPKLLRGHGLYVFLSLCGDGEWPRLGNVASNWSNCHHALVKTSPVMLSPACVPQAGQLAVGDPSPPRHLTDSHLISTPSC